MQAVKIVESSMMEIEELEKKKHIINLQIEENKNIIRQFCSHSLDLNRSCLFCGLKIEKEQISSNTPNLKK